MRSDSPQGGTLRLRWEDFGWMGDRPADGPVRLLVVAPWCPDCLEVGPVLKSETSTDRPVFLVGEFAPKEDVVAFAKKFDLDWPMLFGTGEKSETCREKARFREVRAAYQDDRHWGVPTWIDGTLQSGWFFCENLWF